MLMESLFSCFGSPMAYFLSSVFPNYLGTTLTNAINTNISRGGPIYYYSLVMDCCSPKDGDQVANFSETHLQNLTASCSGRRTCETNAVQGPIAINIYSSFVVVRYTCTIGKFSNSYYK